MNDWLRVPIGIESSRWITRPGRRTVLFVAHTVVAGTFEDRSWRMLRSRWNQHVSVSDLSPARPAVADRWSTENASAKEAVLPKACRHRQQDPSDAL